MPVFMVYYFILCLICYANCLDFLTQSTQLITDTSFVSHFSGHCFGLET
jgi:hypothetical protein